MEGTAFGKQEDVAGDAHNKTEAVVFSEEKLYASDIFRMLCFKVLPCCKLYNHNWKTCPFLHEGEKAGRRDPQKYRYVGIECMDAKRGDCPRGEDCPYAHNLFEFWLHPSRYRTQLCNKPSACRRKVCFFAHNVKELRQPSMGVTNILGFRVSSPNDLDSNNSEVPAVEYTSLESESIIGHLEQTSSSVPDGSVFPSSCSDSPDSVFYRSAAFFACERSASVQQSSSDVSPRFQSGLKFQKSFSTFSPHRETPTPLRMSPKIPAFRDTSACQQETDPQSPYAVLDGSMHLDSIEAYPRVTLVSTSDFSSSDDC